MEGIKKENYEKFTQLASHMGTIDSSEGVVENYTFDLNALARIVDIAYCEGQIKELTRDESYAEDADKIDRLGSLQTLIQNALPEDFVEEDVSLEFEG